ncbi:MliC family protein [Pseudomonas cremoricolorata]|uniref:Lipoprotein n=1 Tax=Pseudomonas cremoricolorata TaxID=157783 RepID=A0A089WGC0_9PSED|nr:MliC family protein [Pseudomonas cremoricolorata]AIR88360.1 lipoprotein [Pseudomonas cremoricolorata]
MKALMAAMAVATLAGCSLLQPSAPSVADNWTRWVCDSQTEVLWRFTDASRSAMDVRLGSRAYHLQAEPSGSGALYSDGVLAMHTKGDEGLVYWVATDDLIGRGCKAP